MSFSNPIQLYTSPGDQWKNRTHEMRPEHAGQLEAFLREHVTLIVLGDFPDSSDIILFANDFCWETGSIEQQAILWIKEDSLRTQLTPTLMGYLQQTISALELSGKDSSAFRKDLGSLRGIFISPVDLSATMVIPKDGVAELEDMLVSQGFSRTVNHFLARRPA